MTTVASISILSAIVAALAQPAPSPPPTPEPQAPVPAPSTPAAPTPAAAEPSPGDIMKDLENAKPKAAAPAAPDKDDPGSDARTPTGRLLREGTFIANRKGRMVRSSSGDWSMTFDGDADGPADPPMILMPCLNLMAMEKIAERGGDALTFSVSGQVFVYKGRNYLLPSMYVINRAGDLIGGK
ncbi:MAG: hypothetical protein ACKVS8_03405 [Phycisphaerales bacterium]